MNQLNLESEATSAARAYQPRRDFVQRRLAGIFDQLRGAPAWPWSAAMVHLYRERTLPYLYGRLQRDEERVRWRSRIEAEMSRLDATSVPF